MKFKCPKPFILLHLLFGLVYCAQVSYAASEPPWPPCETQIDPSICAKIGQMLIVGFGGLNQDANGKILWQDPNGTVFTPQSNIAREIKNQNIGGVILFTLPFRNAKTGQFIRDRNIQNPMQVAHLNADLQTYAAQVNSQKGLPNLPLLISVDQEGGMVDRLPNYLGFPVNPMIPQAFGNNEERVFTNPEARKKALEQTLQYANQVADELRASHFNLNFVPSVDININPLNPIIGGRGRSFSYYPQIVVDQATQFIRAFHDKNIITSLKHFPGHGSSIKDTHKGLVDVTDTYQMDKELYPYRVLIQQGYLDLVMTTHVINGQIDKTQCSPGAPEDHDTWCPGTMSYITLTKLLREQLGFKGIIISDDMTMGAIAKEYPLEMALEKAINAGVNMFIVSNNEEDETEKVVNTIAKLIKEGKVSEERINESYKRILELKKRYH